MGKGSGRRPTLISTEEVDLRWQLIRGEVSREEFDKEVERIRKERPKTKDIDWRAGLVEV
jgi:hypothetical protein